MAEPPASVPTALRARLTELATGGGVATELPNGPPLTWSQLLHRAGELAERLARLGAGRGSRVAAVFAESAWCDFVVACYGTWLAGSVLVPVSASWPASRRAEILGDADVSLVVSAATAASGEHLWVEALPESELGDTQPGPTVPADLATITATSGSGGVPRLVGAVYRDVLDLFDEDDAADDDDGDDDGDDRVESDGPMSEPVLLAVPAIGTAAAQHLVSGLLNGTRLLAVPHFDPQRDADLLPSRTVTVVSLMPSLARGLVAEVEKRDLDVSSVRSVVCSSAPLGAELFDRIAAAFPSAMVMNAFAMSEGVFLVNTHGAGPPDSIGRADEDTEVRIVGLDGNDLEPGSVGEIWLRSRLGPPRQQLLGARAGGTVIRSDGWVATGDLGYTDRDGWVYYAGRRDGVVVVAGSNVSPYVVEQALGGHPAVLDVAVVGVPDPVLGHRLVAHLTLDAPIAVRDLYAHCADRLPAAERPSTIVVVPELPRLPGGKVDRHALRAWSVTSEATGRSAALLDTVRGCWHEVLGGTPVGDDDDLSLVGSFSLLATEVAGRLTTALDRQVAPGLPVAFPSIRGLAAELRTRLARGSLVERPTVRRAPRRS